MVPRLLLTALVAMLAVALPASAEEDPAAAPGPEPSGAPVCQFLDPVCVPVVDETWSQAAAPAFQDPSSASDPGGDSSECRVFDLSNDADPLHIVDPDGCWWRFIRRTLGIGMETTGSFGGWTADHLPYPFP